VDRSRLHQCRRQPASSSRCRTRARQERTARGARQGCECQICIHLHAQRF
jgi:hypothetical protein